MNTVNIKATIVYFSQQPEAGIEQGKITGDKKKA